MTLPWIRTQTTSALLWLNSCHAASPHNPDNYQLWTISRISSIMPAFLTGSSLNNLMKSLKTCQLLWILSSGLAGRGSVRCFWKELTDSLARSLAPSLAPEGWVKHMVSCHENHEGHSSRKSHAGPTTWPKWCYKTALWQTSAIKIAIANPAGPRHRSNPRFLPSCPPVSQAAIHNKCTTFPSGLGL